MSFLEDFYELEEEYETEEKKKPKKRIKRIITVELDEKYINKLKSDSIMKTFGETDILIKTHGKVQHERFYGNRLEALNIALKIKNENPESTVKMIIK